MFKRFFPTGILPIVISFNFSLASAGPAPEVWKSRYNGTGSGKESFLGMAVDEKGSVYVAGTTSSRAAKQFVLLKASDGRPDWVVREPGVEDAVLAVQEGEVYLSSPAEGGYLTRKYDTDGRMIWSSPPNAASTHPAVPEAIARDRDGNTMVTGQVANPPGRTDLLTVKYDPRGALLWARTDASAQILYPRNLLVDESGNLVVTVWYGSQVGQDYEIYCLVLGYLPTGEIRWQEWVRDALPVDSALDRTGNVLVLANSRGLAPQAFLILKYDSSGKLLWNVTHGVSFLDYGRALRVDAAGNVYVAYSRQRDASRDYFILKYDSSGSLLWSADYGAPDFRYDAASSLAVDRAGNAYLRVWGRRASSTDEGFTMVKYDPAGQQLWVENDAGSAPALALDAKGNLYLGGISSSRLTVSDFRVRKYDAGGRELWTLVHDEPGNREESAYLIAPDRAGNLYVAGVSAPYPEGPRLSAVQKLDPSGREIWSTVYDNGANSSPHCLAVDDHHQVHLGASTSDGSRIGYLVQLFAADGKVAWVRQFGTEDPYGSVGAMALDASGNTHLSGHHGTYSTDLVTLTLKYDLAGNLLWKVEENGTFKGMALGRDGSLRVLVVGVKTVTKVIKYSPDGALLWRVDYPDCRAANSVSLDESGNCFVALIGAPFKVVKLNPDGAELWSVPHEVPQYPYDLATVVDPAGNVFVTVLRENSEDGALVKFDPAGKELWSLKPPHQIAVTPVVDSGGNFFLASPWSADSTAMMLSADGRRVWEATYNHQDDTTDVAAVLAPDSRGNVYLAVNPAPKSRLTDHSFVILKYSNPVAPFLRGDCDANGKISVSDVVFLLQYLFAGGPAPSCSAACDANGDAESQGGPTDAISLLRYLFLRGPAPPLPFPRCGVGLTETFDCRNPLDC